METFFERRILSSNDLHFSKVLLCIFFSRFKVIELRENVPYGLSMIEQAACFGQKRPKQLYFLPLNYQGIMRFRAGNITDFVFFMETGSSIIDRPKGR